MELVLKQNIEHLGRLGDVVKVTSGYARNYLLPRGLAVMLTKSNLAEIDRARAQALVEEEGRVASLKELAAKITEASATIEGRANAEGNRFGSESSAQIPAAPHSATARNSGSRSPSSTRCSACPTTRACPRSCGPSSTAPRAAGSRRS